MIFKINTSMSEYKYFFLDPLTVSLLIFSLGIIIIGIHIEVQIRKKNNGLFYIEELGSTLTAHQDNVFWVYDVINNKYEYLSLNFERIFEFDQKLLVKDGISFLNFFSPEVGEKVRQLYYQKKPNLILEFDFEYLKPKSKKKSWFMIKGYPICKHNIILRYICIATDISKEKQIQLELSMALEELQKANDAKKNFLSHMSHEMKTPISAIIGLTTVASKSLEDAEVTRMYLNKIDYVSRNLLTIINNILDLSKIDSMGLILNNDLFSMSSMISALSSIIKEQAEIKNQTYLYRLNEVKDDYIIGDSLRLSQILTNCLSNSIKFTPMGGKIQLVIEETQKIDQKAFYTFTIIDDGKGMSEEYLEHIFDPFEQEDNSISKKYGGTGLGMTITKELINLMGGDIAIQSKVEAGTIVTITIGFLLSDTVLMDHSEGIVKNNKFDHKKGKRILLVEDNDVNREVTSEILRGVNLLVETAPNGYSALQLFEASEKGCFDIILMDLHMPGIDGYKATELIRKSKHPDANTIIIISLSADDYINDYDSINSGINYHIYKPVDINLLLSLIS